MAMITQNKHNIPTFVWLETLVNRENRNFVLRFELILKNRQKLYIAIAIRLLMQLWHNSHVRSDRELCFVQKLQNVDFFAIKSYKKHILNDCCETY